MMSTIFTDSTSLLFRGDRVFIAIRNKIHSKLINDKNNKTEVLFVLVKIFNLIIIIDFVYIYS